MAYSPLLYLCLLPRTDSDKPNSGQISALQSLVETYAVDAQCNSDVAVAELQLWYRQLSMMNEYPRNALEAYTLCSEITWPCIKKLLQIMVTLPVTTCTSESERSFSTLRRVKRICVVQWAATD